MYFEIHPCVCISILLSNSCVDMYSYPLICPQTQLGQLSSAAVIIPAEVFMCTLVIISLAKYLRVEFQGHRVGVC